ncbi:MAG TPA: glycosyltransferase [Terriglobales bacterium]|nr:glycosyltransferase [Terriglobales bacterium]
MRKLTIVFFDAGGGHRNAAEALKGTLETQARPWEVCLLNLQELLDSLDLIRRATGIRIQDGYNLILRRGWTRPTPQLLGLLRGLIRLYHRQVVAALQKYWQQNRTDLVLSVIPLFNRALAESLRESAPATAFATLLTDLADCPPHFWMEDESEFLICGTERAEQQALEMGHARSRVFKTSGMILKPKFYEKPRVNVAAERARHGLDPELPTGIVLFGGHGSPAMLEIARRLSESANRVQLIMICGHNQKLRTELAGMQSPMPMLVEGFTWNMAYYMALADFFVGKPGPGSISEALQFHLPVIVERNQRTMPQERYNTDWVAEKRLGVVLRSFSEIAGGVEQLLWPETFAELCGNARAFSNRALFEVPFILDEVLERHVPYSVSESLPDVRPLGPDAAWASLT